MPPPEPQAWPEQTQRSSSQSSKARSIALAVAVAYGCIGAFWIIGSDWVVVRMLGEGDLAMLASTIKGWFYVALTAVILYFTIKKVQTWTADANERLLRQEDRLDFILRGLGGLWEMDCQTGAMRTSYHIKMLLGLPADFGATAENWRMLVHPEDRERVITAQKSAMATPGRLFHVIYRMRDMAGGLHWFQTKARVQRNARGEPVMMIGITIDVTELYEAQAKLSYLAHHDSLTRLPNRTALVAALEAALTDRADDEQVLLLRFNIAHFNDFNTTYGHAKGDRILREFADRLRQLGGSDGYVACLGADEFALVHQGLRSGASAQQGVEDLMQRLTAPLLCDERSIHLTVRCGAAMSPGDGATADALMTAAGLALAKCKEDMTVQAFYAHGMDAAFRLTVERSQALRGAIDRGELQVHYQPIVSLETGRTVGFEALARWSRPEEGMVPPDAFIRIAEDIGMIGALGRWVLETACRDVAALGGGPDGPFVAVNISPVQIGTDEFVNDVAAALDLTGLAPGRLELEITESALASDYRQAADRLRPLRDLGLSIAIDDFGTGYSSLTALRHLPCTRLKLDQSFVRGYGRDKSCTVIIDTVLALARGMDLDVTAEGVETADLRDRLRGAGCGLAQGFLFSPALPVAAAAELHERRWFAPGGAPSRVIPALRQSAPRSDRGRA